MRKIILLAILAAIAWQGQSSYRARHLAAEAEPSEASTPEAAGRGSAAPETFSCDGRIHCSQMSSCAQAEYFLKNCPGVKMDGDHDGIPCEQQWCGQ